MKISARLRRVVLPLFVACAAACASNSAQLQSASPTPPDPLRIQTFDLVAMTIGENAAHLMASEEDWPTVVQAHRERALGEANSEAFYGVINEMVGTLGISHTLAIPPPMRSMNKKLEASTDIEPITIDKRVEIEADSAQIASGAGDGGIDFRWREGQLYLSEVMDKSPASEAGLKAGLRVLQLQGESVEGLWQGLSAEFNHSQEAPLRMRQKAKAQVSGPAGGLVSLVVQTSEEGKVLYRFPRIPQVGQSMTFGHLTVVGKVQSKWITPKVGYVHFNVFMMDLMPQLISAIEGLKGAEAIIVDLRGNLGGIAGMSQALAARLIDTPVNLGMMKNAGFDVKFPVFPRPGAFSGQLLVLVDGESASTSEIFAVGLQEANKATIIGEQTAGLVLPSLIVSLPDGGLLQYATALYLTDSGKVLEGVGVQPDIEVPWDAAALLIGKDPVLEAALEAVILR